METVSYQQSVKQIKVEGALTFSDNPNNLERFQVNSSLLFDDTLGLSLIDLVVDELGLHDGEGLDVEAVVLVLHLGRGAVALLRVSVHCVLAGGLSMVVLVARLVSRGALVFTLRFVTALAGGALLLLGRGG